jgi:hypothetical protein
MVRCPPGSPMLISFKTKPVCDKVGGIIGCTFLRGLAGQNEIKGKKGKKA